VYLASSFDLKEKVQQISDILESKGIVITRKWWFTDYKIAFGEIPDEEWYRREKVRWLSQENFKAIDQADAVILVCPNDSPHNFTGANIEVGYAIAKNKRVLSVGALGRSAMYVPLEKHSTLDALVTVLTQQQ
jgi:nucleoside 2-deoxyribosyltransferase